MLAHFRAKPTSCQNRVIVICPPAFLGIDA
jgi:hypothetical protein